MRWSVFCTYVAAMWEERAETADENAYRPDGYAPPDRDALIDMPWRGDGPDPLEELYEAS